VDHGIGLFSGVRKISTEYGTKEYLTIEYAEGDKLSVPTEFLDRLTSYFSPGEEHPTLTRLGTQEWSRLRGRAEKAALDMAKDLLDLYAARQILPGFAFSPDGVWQQELESTFPYQETPDQLRAVEEIKADMEEARPLDRLICGDVGFGKTEVALRAAFKAIQDSKQVVILCPTTILAEQHYTTFQERLSAFPVKIDVITRFDNGKELEKKLDRVKTGSVDIVIGTHRLLQKDVVFNDLGLVVIDDEQRFGVAHKEQFKKFRQGLDVLSMTATPIPRTLYMALARIRDMSIIETPPANRKAIETYVAEYTDELIQQSINRELSRGGQIFFVHNRIRDIEEWAYRIQELVPEAKISIGHGQMDKTELEKVMREFTRGITDILLCTTIIESGLDIPNANTIIINRPELMGLSQLYQLRGRVGRGDRKGFAYFLQPSKGTLSDTAEKRLKAILSHQEVGSGFRIAMRDLEIRGTGNILGAQQSGNVNAVGFELYCQMLSEAVANLEENPHEVPSMPQQSTTVELPIAAFLPEEFISHLPQRLGIYQRLATIFTLEDCQSIEQEIIDRFGPLPEEVENLLFVVRIKVKAQIAYIEAITSDSNAIILRMSQPVGGARLALQKVLGPNLKVGEFLIRIPKLVAWNKMLEETLSRLIKFRNQLLEMANV
jgi:transcription-repair coupling factor (superfamily II helicase)